MEMLEIKKGRERGREGREHEDQTATRPPYYHIATKHCCTKQDSHQCTYELSSAADARRLANQTKKQTCCTAGFVLLMYKHKHTHPLPAVPLLRIDQSTGMCARSFHIVMRVSAEVISLGDGADMRIRPARTSSG